MNNTHHYEQLIEIFNGCFAEEFNTRLIKGDDEPIYLPADAQVPYHRIIFAHGFYASALHEISHWCIAGKARRELVDFGYWYCPDGRDAQIQSQFEDEREPPHACNLLVASAFAGDIPAAISAGIVSSPPPPAIESINPASTATKNSTTSSSGETINRS